MDLPSAIYKTFVRSSGIKRLIWGAMRRLTIKLLNDPICLMPINGRALRLPLSHALPDYLERFPHYDRLPQRLSRYLHDRYGPISCIDVGANVGDTIAFVCMDAADTFLAIEPNPKFHRLLCENCGWNKNVTTLAVLCSSDSGQDVFSIKEKSGTASLHKATNGVPIAKRTLDEIAATTPGFSSPTLIKIDTDGYDFEVVAGATKIVSGSRPAVLLESAQFDNTRYVEDCLNALNSFRAAGYGKFLLYDNFGCLMGQHSLSDLSGFRNLLFYQLTSRFFYFDILIMQDDDLSIFVKSEIKYFTANMSNERLQGTAEFASKIWL